MVTSRPLVVLGTVLAALAALLSLLLWGVEVAVEPALVLTVGFAGATSIGVGLLLGR